MEIKADFGRGKIEKEKREERLQKKKIYGNGLW